MKGMTFSSVFNASIDQYKKQFWLLFTIAFVLILIPQFVSNVYLDQSLGLQSDPETLAELITFFVAFIPIFIFLFVCGILYTTSMLVAVKNKDTSLSFGLAFRQGSKHFWSVLGFSILFSIYLMLLALLLIIPALIFMVFWIIAIYIFVYEQRSIHDALAESKQRVTGKWWRIFGYCLLLYLIYGVVYIAMFALLAGLASVSGATLFDVTGPFYYVSTFLELIVGALLNIFMLVFGYNLYLALSSPQKKVTLLQKPVKKSGTKPARKK